MTLHAAGSKPTQIIFFNGILTYYIVYWVKISGFSKASCILGFVKRQSREFLCPYVTKALYCSLVRSTLEYCSVVWSPKTLTDRNRIESIQRKFLLFALRNLNWRNGFQLPAYASRLNLLSMETLELRRRVADCMFAFDMLRKNINVPSLSCLFSIRQPARDTRLASTIQLNVQFASTRYAANETVTRCCRLFNTISQCYDDNCSRDTFRTRVKSLLI